jgi:ribonuclease/clavin/mitogillin
LIRSWIIKLFWNPFEKLCHIFPFVPINSEIKVVGPGIELIVLNNFVTKFLSAFGGGFDYAVIYLIDRELFFDTGYSWAKRTLQKKVFNLLDKNKVNFIVNSHDHEDHTGNNTFFLQSFPKAKVYLHKLAHLQVAFPPEKPLYRRFLFGPEEACPVHELPHSLRLASGRTLDVIHTPGHTDGHVCLYDPSTKTLFTGDLFISESLDTQLGEANGPKWINSLTEVLKLDIDLILDGHGVMIRGSECKSKLKKKLDFLTLLRGRVHELAARGETTQNQLIKGLNSTPGIVNYLSHGEGWMSMISSGDFRRSNLIRGFLEEYVATKQ